jgi:23S rRNA pseudouridine1911/1915/1917 synthase
LREGEVLRITIPGIAPTTAAPPLPPVLHEDDDLLAVDKPAGLLMHSAGQKWAYGLVGIARDARPGCFMDLAHRLDRETSGVVLVAKNAAWARLFGLAMQNRQVSKTYAALVHGSPDWDELVLDAPILRAGEVSECDIWVKQIVHPDGADCRTSFRVLKRFAEGFTLIEARPETGRMHQIRVHLHHLGLPMVGDKLYGRDDRCYLEFIDTGWTPSLQKRLLIPRQALHSKRLELTAEGFNGAWEAPVPDFLAMIGPP